MESNLDKIIGLSLALVMAVIFYGITWIVFI